MRRRSQLLTFDGIANLLLGIAVLTFPEPFFEALGLPWPGHGLYPTILGGVLLGIGIGLIREGRATTAGAAGLGLAGAVTINLAAGLVIAAWLLFSGNDGVSPPGRALLWILVLFLVGLSAAEVAAYRRGESDSDRRA